MLEEEEITRLKKEGEPGQKKKIVEELKTSWNEEQAVIDVKVSPKAQLRKSDGDKDLHNAMSIFAAPNVGEIVLTIPTFLMHLAYRSCLRADKGVRRPRYG